MNSLAEHLQLIDLEPRTDTFRVEVLAGLRSDPKTLPPKFFYDARGSELFDAICNLEEYYLTRTELAIMQDHVGEMSDRLGPGCLVVEYGSGSSLKTRILLAHLKAPAGYVPIDISREHLLASASELQREFPSIEVLPICADYTDVIELPSPRQSARIAVYFPGSTIGNFSPPEAVQFLRRMAAVCGPDGALLIGADLKKSPDVLRAAYNDSKGVTAAFNKNLLRRMNRELGANFRLSAFEHDAVFNEPEGRIEMYLVSTADQDVSIGGEKIRFQRGERICTEYSQKYALDEFSALAESAGFRVEQVWTDPRKYFSVQYLVAK